MIGCTQRLACTSERVMLRRCSLRYTAGCSYQTKPHDTGFRRSVIPPCGNTITPSVVFSPALKVLRFASANFLHPDMFMISLYLLTYLKGALSRYSVILCRFFAVENGGEETRGRGVGQREAGFCRTFFLHQFRASQSIDVGVSVSYPCKVIPLSDEDWL